TNESVANRRRTPQCPRKVHGAGGEHPPNGGVARPPPFRGGRVAFATRGCAMRVPSQNDAPSAAWGRNRSRRNVEHRTSNVQRRMKEIRLRRQTSASRPLSIRRSKFDVRRLRTLRVPRRNQRV